MCGIAGLWCRDGEMADEANLREMGGKLKHRGPDDEGIWMDGEIGMAHRRLSIIDLSAGGHQPMVLEGGQQVLVFNGEIYNYRELKEKYLAGVSWRSESDTEVLLRLLMDKGEEALQLVRGMFALAWWNGKTEELLLARDPFGKKPLYYMENDKQVFFASEMKALVERLGKFKLDNSGAVKYLVYEYVPAPMTGYRDVREVPMGTWMKISRQKVRQKKYWQPKFRPKIDSGENKLLTKFDELLISAVERRMVADVPVGLLLSGGLDSTTIGWYMKRQAKNQLHSFSVSFDESSFDESGFAARAADDLGFEHHRVLFGVEEFRKSMEKVMPAMDVPLGDASLLPTFEVSKLAREKVKVVLDGDGGDELLGGYGTFKAMNIAEKLPRLNQGSVNLMLKILALMPISHQYFSWDFKAKSFVKGLAYPLPVRNQIWLGAFSEVELKELLWPEWSKEVDKVFNPIYAMENVSAGLSNNDTVALLTMVHYLHNGILVKLDRATMMVGLEARTPFLDIDLADWLLRLPDKWRQEKYLLKRLMRGRILTDIIDRPKKGFGIPLGYWLKGPLYSWASKMLNEEKLSQQGIIRSEVVRRLLVEHHDGLADHRKKLWTLLVWQMWYERWVDSEDKKRGKRGNVIYT